MPNLIQNPSFETGLLNWKFSNVDIAADDPLEGAAVARMGEGVANLFQDIFIGRLRRPSFSLSFGVAAPEDEPGNLSVNVQWLDDCCRLIGNGLALLIPSETIFDQDGWLTLSAVTELAPPNTAFARILFSKMAECRDGRDVLDIDLVVMSVE